MLGPPAPGLGDGHRLGAFGGLCALINPIVGLTWLVLLLPYIGTSYYDRYAAPLFGVKVLLVVWAADRLLSRRAGPTTRIGEGPSVQGILSKLPRNC